jgi:hypothetical protein
MATTGLAAPSMAIPVEPPANDPPTALFLVSAEELVESSGLAVGASGRVVWTHNDAGNDAVVYALDPSGGVQATAELVGVAAEDWEDIATATVGDTDFVYVADTGDAYQVRSAAGKGTRRAFQVLRFREPELASVSGDLDVPVESLDVVFPKKEGVNVEAMAVSGNGGIILVEKVGERGGKARVWSIEEPRWSQVNTPKKVGTVPYVGVSGAALDREGAKFALRNDAVAAVYPVVDGLPDLSAPPAEVALPDQQQGESLTFTQDAQALLVGSEGRSQAVWFVPLVDGLTPGIHAVEPPQEEQPAGPPTLASGAVLVAGLGVLGLGAVRVVRRPGRGRRRAPWIEVAGQGTGR